MSHYHNVHYIKGTSPRTKCPFKRLCTSQLANNRLKKKGDQEKIKADDVYEGMGL